jgi:hypothetical protein
MRKALLLVVITALIGSDVEDAYPTDVGKAGNAALAKRFEAWKAGDQHLLPSEAKRRILFTGFGLFSGVDFNISGVVAASMADPEFWPTKVKLTELVGPAKGATPATGILAEGDNGARVWQRTLHIDGEAYEIGFLLVDVLWDLGAAITLHEAATFKPHLIVMTGRGGPRGVFEAGALNVAVRAPGFRANGDVDPANRPTDGLVLPVEGVEREIAMRWDGPAMLEIAQPIVASLDRGYEIIAAKAARPGNTYICNNISCCVLHALSGQTLELAGGKIKIPDPKLAKTRGGFFHYPAAARNDAAEVFTWCRMWATLFQAHFAASTPTAE